jgi:putative oxidoreductase
MDSLFTFLFPLKLYPRSVSLMLLVVRVMFGALLMWHGMTKIVNVESVAENFPNPLGLGPRLSFYLVVFAEVICSAAVVMGAFYRLALIPIIFAMGVALFVVHHGQPFAAKELALIYFVIFVLLYYMGAGAYSLDNIIAKRLDSARLAKVDEVVAVKPVDYISSEG